MLRHLLTDFIEQDRAILEKTMKEVLAIATECAIALGFKKDDVGVSAFNLYSAFERYTRDSFGYQRIASFADSRFGSLSGNFTEQQKDALEELKNDLLNELKGSGMRIPSSDPYAHRRCALLLHHLNVLKPFHIRLVARDDFEAERKAFYNAFVSVCLMKVILATFGATFRPHLSMLRTLTYHPPSRSATEEIMRNAIMPPKV